jgi:hypothetical protein
MATTPRDLLAVLDMVTANQLEPERLPAFGFIERLGPVANLQLTRTRSVFDDENVVGAGIAEKLTEGRKTGELGLVFYVKSKVAPENLDPTKIVPPVVAGPSGRAVFTDVVEVGEILPEVNAARPPLKSGFSIGHFNITAGTLGAIVKKRGKPYTLSNSHVLAESGLAAVGDTILFPGQADGGANPADRCGALTAFTPFVVGNSFTNKADAALASIDPGLIGSIVPGILGASSPLKVATPQRGMRVIKRGRTTGDTESIVRDTDFRIMIGYPGVGIVGYTAGGDSGSIVVDKASGAIVGLHFAGSPTTSVFTPIRTVMDALRFKF